MRTKTAEPYWSIYQLDIFDWVNYGTGHGLIGAVAGSGKTKTIEGVVSRIPTSRLKTAVMAFNVHIVEELKQRLGKRSGLTISTCHSMGLSILIRYFKGIGVLTGELKINQHKYRDLCIAALQNLVRLRVEYETNLNLDRDWTMNNYSYPVPAVGQNTRESKALEYEITRFLGDCVRYAQMTLTDPTPTAITHMADHFGLQKPTDPYAASWVFEQVPFVLDKAEKLAHMEQDIALADLIWLPNKWDLYVPPKNFVIVDEGQDANRAQMSIYLKMVANGGRLIMFGDERQAIMGFAGSDADSWQTIRHQLRPTELPLSICYRCPISHLELAKRIVPHIQPRPGAAAGRIETINQQTALDIIEPGDLVICRFTSPLVRMCLKLIVKKVNAKVRGKDIGKSLVSLAKIACGSAPYPTSFCQQLDEYVAVHLIELQQKKQVSYLEIENWLDKKQALFTCFEEFGYSLGSLEEFCDKIESIFASEDEKPKVILSTIHRAKGDEAITVFLLGSDALPFTEKAQKSWQVTQEYNLTYVALSRALSTLYLVPLRKVDLNDPLGGMSLPEPALTQEPTPQPRWGDVVMGNGDDPASPRQGDMVFSGWKPKPIQLDLFAS